MRIFTINKNEQEICPILSMEGITKRFPGVIAVNNVDFDFYKGELKAIVGENGAGKSTLIKILSGMYKDYEGKIYVNGKRRIIANPVHSIGLGINVVFQEFNLINELTVCENIFLGHELLKSKILCLLNNKSMHAKARELLENFKIDIDSRIKIKDLGVAQSQIVEIIKALYKKSKIIIMDEPTAALTKSETDMLFEIIRDLKRKGISIIYISHRIDEIFDIADKVSVMKDGRVIFSEEIISTNRNEIIKYMIGKEQAIEHKKSYLPLKKELLTVEKLNGKKVKNVSFSLYEGEILGFTGRVGSGRTQLMRTIFGAEKIKTGRIMLEGLEVLINCPSDAIKIGIGFLTEDRKNQGLILLMTIGENICMPILRMLSKYFVIIREKIDKLSRQKMNELKIRAPNVNYKALYLSGGNQQKVVLAKWLCSNAKILIFDEPTRGIDVATKFEIYNIIEDYKHKGKGIILITSDIEEIYRICDRVIVMDEGQIVNEFKIDQIEKIDLIKYLERISSNGILID